MRSMGLTCVASWRTGWRGESLEDRRLKEICGREFNRVQQFFVWEGHRWHHKRIDAELRDADNKMKVARDKAMERAYWRVGPRDYLTQWRLNGRYPWTQTIGVLILISPCSEEVSPEVYASGWGLLPVDAGGERAALLAQKRWGVVVPQD